MGDDFDYSGLNQDDRVYEFLKRHGSIEPLQAWERLGIYRLGACIHRLRRDLPIETKRCRVRNKFGEPCHFARYFLHEEGV